MQEIRRMEFKAEGLGFLRHPVQRLVGEAVGAAAAAHVGVRAREPHLRELPGPARRAHPDAGRERLAALVDGERLVGVLDSRVELDVVILVLVAVEELPERAGRAERAHGVPDADEADLRAGARMAHALERRLPVGRVGGLARLVERVHPRRVVLVLLLQEAHLVHEAAERAHRERAAAEAEHVDLVAGLVVVDQEAVERAHIELDALAESAPGELVQPAGGAEAVVVVDHLVDATRRERQHRARCLEDVGGLRSTRGLVVLLGLVPGAVGAEDDALHASKEYS
jgi:hypothetical protein